MRVYDAWKRVAFDPQGQPVKHVWDEYLAIEKNVYAKLLKDKTTHLEGTVAQLGESLGFSNIQTAAFLDGLHECVDGLPEIGELEETTAVKLDIEHQRLYKQMVEYKADSLYKLPEWDLIFTPEQQKQFYTEQKKSHTIVRNENKVGRNDPCPCNSGKKYKKCCGA